MYFGKTKIIELYLKYANLVQGRGGCKVIQKFPSDMYIISYVALHGTLIIKKQIL